MISKSTFSALFGIFVLSLLISCGGSSSRVSDNTPDTDALAVNALVNINAIAGLAAEDIATDADGIAVALTELEIGFSYNALVGEVDGMLDAIDGEIIFSAEGVAILLVRIPNPGGITELDAVVAQLQANPIVRFVRKGYFPAAQAVASSLPADHADLLHLSDINHQLAVRAHGAWNVRQVLQDAAVRPPTLIVADDFGDGPPGTDFSLLQRAADFLTSPADPHGYHVLGIIAADFEGSQTQRGLMTGIYPAQLTLSAVDMARNNLTWPAIEGAIIGKLQNSPGNAVVNTSIGFECNTEASAALLCSREHAEIAAISWIEKVRNSGLEQKFVHLTAAGNTRVTGDTNAAFSSPFAAARLIGDLQLLDLTFPPLQNTLVVENLIAAGTPPRPVCLSGEAGNASKYPGDLSAVGTDVWSLTLPGVPPGIGTMSGTSMATPQVAGMAAYLWALEPALSSFTVVDALRNAARPVVLNTAADFRCNLTIPPAPVLDAYAVVLAADSFTLNAVPMEHWRTRLALLDVADYNGDPGRNGYFDDEDIRLLLDRFDLLDGERDYSRYDLNGDGQTGGSGSERFDLNVDGAFGTAVQTISGEEVDYNETSVTDMDILCYYAYSNLYVSGAQSERDELLEGRCTGGLSLIFGSFYQDYALKSWTTISTYDYSSYTTDTQMDEDFSPAGGIPRLTEIGPGCMVEGGDLVAAGQGRVYRVSSSLSTSIGAANSTAWWSAVSDSQGKTLQLSFAAQGAFAVNEIEDGLYHIGSFAGPGGEPSAYMLISNDSGGPMYLEAEWFFTGEATLNGCRDSTRMYDSSIATGAAIYLRPRNSADAVSHCDTPADWRLVTDREMGDSVTSHENNLRLSNLLGARSGTVQDEARVEIPPGRHFIALWLDFGAVGSSPCGPASGSAQVSGNVEFRLTR